MILIIIIIIIIVIVLAENNNNKQLCKWKVQHDIRHWNCKEKVKMWEILHLSWATIPGMDR